tara:strand:+ start:2342 stop:2992 length:651 start_codon:yes stop_codon:yes gene_type:complete
VRELLVIIVARKGSKRLKNKNFMYLGSKTLVERSIIFAKKLVENKNIILSTDSKKILEIGKENEILVPWLRPKNLSQDSSKSVDVALHALKWYEKNIKKKKFILLLQPTTPFRNLIFFKKALSTIIKNKKNNYVSVSPLKNRAQINKNLKFKNKVLNQKKNKNYYFNGSMYLISTNEIKKKKSFITKSTIGMIIKEKKFLLDIDNRKDLNLAKTYL